MADQELVIVGGSSPGEGAPTEPGGAPPLLDTFPNIGWTNFILDSGNVVYHVDPLTGDDSYTGQSELYTGVEEINGRLQGPYETLSHALERANPGDWIKIKAGTTISEGDIVSIKSGASADNPILISSYGSGARPIIASPLYLGGSDLALVDLHFEAPSSPLFSVESLTLTGGTGILVEGCYFTGSDTGIYAVDVTDLTIRRCVVEDVVSIGVRCSSCSGILIEQSYFWKASGPQFPGSWGAVDLLTSYAVEIKECLFTDLESGVVVEAEANIHDCYFEEVNRATSWAGDGGTFADNVVVRVTTPGRTSGIALWAWTTLTSPVSGSGNIYASHGAEELLGASWEDVATGVVGSSFSVTKDVTWNAAGLAPVEYSNPQDSTLSSFYEYNFPALGTWTRDGFMQLCAEQSKIRWYDNISPAAVLEYARAKYDE